LPKTVISMIPSGVVRGQPVIVSRTNRQLVGGISSKTVLRAVAFVLWSSAVVNVLLPICRCLPLCHKVNSVGNWRSHSLRPS
jgi:hypothetical protein